MNLACGLSCSSECGHLCSPCVGRSLGEGALSLFASQLSPLSDRTCGRGSSKRMVTTAATPVATQLRFRQQQRLRQQLQSQGATGPRTPLPQPPLPPLGRRAASTDNDETQGRPCNVSADESRVPQGCARYSVELRKPLGLLLEEDRSGGIFVASVVQGGNADCCGLVGKGDQLLATSGYIYENKIKYQETWVPSGEKAIRLTTHSEDFNTVMAAIRSHPAQKNVRLEFQRCK